MRRVCVACALGVVLLVSACGEAPKPVAIPKVPPQLRAFIRTWSASIPDGQIDQIDVYGPSPRAPLVRAAMGPGARAALAKRSLGYAAIDRSRRFYLVVLHGDFVCTGCVGPHPLIPPHSKIQIAVWSAPKGETDWGVFKNLLPGVKKLHRLAQVRVT